MHEKIVSRQKYEMFRKRRIKSAVEKLKEEPYQLRYQRMMKERKRDEEFK